MTHAVPTPAAPARCTVVLAVKALDDAKSRLTPLPATAAQRRALVTAMLEDTLTAVAATGPGRIVVVSPDPCVHEVAARLGAHTVDEPPAGDRPAGWSSLNAALHHGARSVAPAGPVVYLQADLPALRPASLSDAVALAVAAVDRGTAAFVADRSGEGTVLLAADLSFAPRFGPRSADAHRGAGAAELDPAHEHWPDLRTDIDTPADLVAAQTLGLGPSTAESEPARTTEVGGPATA